MNDVGSLNGFSYYAGLRFVGIVVSSPINVALTILRVQYTPNLQQRTILGIEPLTANEIQLEEDGYINDDLAPQYASINQCIGHVYRQAGVFGLFRGTFTSYLSTILVDVLEPAVSSIACDLVGLDDLLLPVDHDHPLPITLVSICSSVLTHMLVSPLQSTCCLLQVHGGMFFQHWRSQSFTSYAYVSSTVINALVNAGFTVLTPLLIDRVMGVSELYNPIQYILIDYAIQNVKALISVPLQTALCRIYTQTPYRRPGNGFCIQQSIVPYSSTSNCLVRILYEEGNSLHEYNKTGNEPKSFYSDLVHYVAPLYHGLSLRLLSNAGFLAISLLSYSLDLNEQEF